MANAESLKAQDLSGELLLQQALKDIGGQRRPVLGDIPLLAKLDNDATGARYYAVHPGLEREVVVKVMPCDEPATPRTALLLAHANAALRVKSPRVVELLEFAKEAGVIFFVTEYAQGKTADSYLNALRSQLKTGLDEGVALEIGIAAAEGLAAAHAATVLHLDLRPANIVIPAGQGEMLVSAEAKLDGLGLAYNGFAGRLLAGTRGQSGTPGFMSPEQVVGASSFSAACDVFSFGATIYALLAGQSPFDGPDLGAILYATTSQEAGSVRTWRPDVSRATAKVIEICLRKNPVERFMDGSVLHKALLICRGAKSGTPEEQDVALVQIESLVRPVEPPEVEQVPPTLVPAPPTVAPVPPTLAPAPPTLVVAPRPVLSAFAGPRTAVRELERSEPAVEDTLIAGAAPVSRAQATVIQTRPKEESELTLPSGRASSRIPAPRSSDSKLNALASRNQEEPPPEPRLEEAPPGELPEVSPPARHGLRIALAAAVLLVLGCIGAWQLGWLNKWNNPRPSAPASLAAKTSPSAQEYLAAEAQKKAKAAEQKKEEERRAAEAKAEQERLAAEAQGRAAEQKKEEERRASEAKAKAELERLAVEAQVRAADQKKEEDRRAAEAKAKAEQERLAAEQKKEEDRRAAEAKAKAEQERLAAEQKKEEDRRAAEAKAEQERLAAEAQTRAAEQKKEEDRRAAEAKAKAEQERLAAEAQTRAAEQKKEEDRRATEQAASAQQASPPVVEPRKRVVLELAPGVRMEFVSVPGGSFMMGTARATLENLATRAGVGPEQYLDETPAHRVSVSPFYIGRGPVTLAQFRAFVAATGHKTAAERSGEAYTLRDGAWQRTPGACWKNPGFRQADDHPVVLVSFRDCEAIAVWAARKTGKPLRLPTETEWEYAGRGPNNFSYPWGDEWNGRLANYCDASLKPFGLSDWKYSTGNDGFPFTSPAGKFRNQSWCGAVDLAGNVLQWCADTYEPYPQSPNAPQLLVDEAAVPLDAPRVLRGGSYLSSPLECRAAVRRSSSPRSASCEFGVRLAFTPAAVKGD